MKTRRVRKKRPIVVRALFKFKWFVKDIVHRKENALASASANFLFKDLYFTYDGVEKIAEITGMPEGVIAAAFDNIFEEQKSSFLNGPQIRRRNSMAAVSARYILEDINWPKGISDLAEVVEMAHETVQTELDTIFRPVEKYENIENRRARRWTKRARSN